MRSKLPFLVETLRRFSWYSEAGSVSTNLILMPVSSSNSATCDWRALGEALLELRPGEVQHLDDERVGRLAVRLQRAQALDRATLLGVERVLVALGALETDGAAVHAWGKPLLQGFAARGRTCGARLGRRRCRRVVVVTAASRQPQQTETGSTRAADEPPAADLLTPGLGACGRLFLVDPLVELAHPVLLRESTRTCVPAPAVLRTSEPTLIGAHAAAFVYQTTPRNVQHREAARERG